MAQKPEVYVRDLSWKGIKKEISKFKKGPHTRVGVLSGTGSYEQGGRLSLADIATWMEFGAEINVTDKMRGYLSANGLHLKRSTNVIKIPPRPFMAQAFDENRAELEKFIDVQANRVLSGEATEEDALALIGLFFESKVKQVFVEGDFQQNHPYTVANKGSTRPLVDSGRLRQSISHEVLQSDKK